MAQRQRCVVSTNTYRVGTHPATLSTETVLVRSRQPSDRAALPYHQTYYPKYSSLRFTPTHALVTSSHCLFQHSPSIKYTKGLPINNVSAKPKGRSLWQINNRDHGSSSFTLLLNPSRGYVNDLVLSHHIYSSSLPLATALDVSTTPLSSYCLLYFVSRLEAKETLRHLQQLGHVLPTRIWAKSIGAHTNRRRPENDPVHPSA